MRWHIAEDLIRARSVMERSSVPGRLVFKNEHGDIVEQREGGPMFAFTLSREDDIAGDWEITRKKPGRDRA